MTYFKILFIAKTVSAQMRWHHSLNVNEASTHKLKFHTHIAATTCLMGDF